MAWLTIAFFLGLIVVAIWYDKIIPPVSRALAQFMESIQETAPEVTGTANAGSPVTKATDFPAGSELSKIQFHLNGFLSENRSLARNFISLAVSVLAFVLLGLLSNSLTTVSILVVVILIHELGHFIGMKIFGYRNVHIFFIPLFGAATSGIEANPSGSQKAIVSLLGPLPGILIGIGLCIAYAFTENEMLIQPARQFIFINALNLLPFIQLDGERFWESIYSTRGLGFEIAFKVISVLGAAFISFILLGWLLFLLSVSTIFIILIMSIANTYITASTVRAVAGRFSISDDLHTNHIPPEYMSAIYDVLKPKFLFSRNPGDLAQQIYYVWQRLLNKPPGRKAASALIAVYFLLLALAVGTSVIFQATLRVPSIIPKTDIQKSPARVESRREAVNLGGRLLVFRTLDGDNLYHGPAGLFLPQTDIIFKSSQYYHGKWHGECKDYDEKGNIIRIWGQVLHYDIMEPSGTALDKSYRRMDIPAGNHFLGLQCRAPVAKFLCFS